MYKYLFRLAYAALEFECLRLKIPASITRAVQGPSKVNMAASSVTGERCRCASAAREETNFLEVALSQETSDLAETSDHEMLASNGISSLWVVLDSSTESRSGGSRSL